MMCFIIISPFRLLNRLGKQFPQIPHFEDAPSEIHRHTAEQDEAQQRAAVSEHQADDDDNDETADEGTDNRAGTLIADLEGQIHYQSKVETIP